MPGSAASPAAVRRTPRPARSSRRTPRSRSSLRICWLIADDVRCESRAAAPTDPVRAMASRLRRAGRSPASIISGSYVTGKKISLYLTVEARQTRRPRRPSHGVIAARQGVGGAHGADAALGADPAPHRPPPDPRGDLAPGLPGPARDEGAGAHARAHLRDPRPHHPDHRAPVAAV